MLDIFNIIQNNNDDVSNKHIKEILDNDNINKLNINWANYLHKSYNYKFNINNISNLINSSLKRILINSLDDNSIVDKINCLSRFYHINSLFEILNELNLSYNQTLKIKDYTLYILQNYYINFIVENEYLVKHWVNGIINITNLDDIIKCRYYNGINILKKYLYKLSFINREEMILKFINIYSNYISKYYISQFNNNKLSLLNIFKKLNKIDEINKILFNDIDKLYFLNNVINNLTILLDDYLNKKILDDYVIKMFNTIKLNNNLIDIITKYVNYWLLNIKSYINISNYTDQHLFKKLILIGPIIIYFI
jgi:hypothetical protein